MLLDWQKKQAGNFAEIDAKEGVSGEASHHASHHLCEETCVFITQVSSLFFMPMSLRGTTLAPHCLPEGRGAVQASSP
jgi:hypothetical protein